MQPNTAALLNRLLAREKHSMLLYLADARPWIASSEHELQSALTQLIAEEADAVAAIGNFLTRQRAYQPAGAFPEGFSELHFVALDHLLPRLVGYQRDSIAGLKGDLAQLDDADALGVVRQLLSTKESHLKELERLTALHAGEKSLATRR